MKSSKAVLDPGMPIAQCVYTHIPGNGVTIPQYFRVEFERENQRKILIRSEIRINFHCSMLLKTLIWHHEEPRPAISPYIFKREDEFLATIGFSHQKVWVNVPTSPGFLGTSSASSSSHFWCNISILSLEYYRSLSLLGKHWSHVGVSLGFGSCSIIASKFWG